MPRTPSSRTPANDNRPTTQTVRIAGKRTRLVTRNGRTTTHEALPLEHELQAAQVRALRAMPEYAATERQAKPGTFTLAADQNAAKRGPKARAQAMAAGMTPGEHDVRIYMYGGRLGLIENKVGNGPLSPAQKARHPLLAALGFDMQAVIRATTPEDAAAQAVAAVRGWLVGSGNKIEKERKRA